MTFTTYSTACMALALCSVSQELSRTEVAAFLPLTVQPVRRTASRTPRLRLSLCMACRVSTLSQDDAVSMGVRDWPQQLKQGSWTEEVNAGDTLSRYVLEGTSIVTVQGDAAVRALSPGSLLEVTGPETLTWQATSDSLLILTPGYEEGGKLLFVALGLVVMCALLVAGEIS